MFGLKNTGKTKEENMGERNEMEREGNQKQEKERRKAVKLEDGEGADGDGDSSEAQMGRNFVSLHTSLRTEP